MHDEQQDSVNPERGWEAPTAAARTARIDAELHLDHLIELARPEPWPLPPRRRLLGRVFRGRRGAPRGLAARLAGYDWTALRRYWGYAAALVLGLAIWALAGAPLTRLYQRSLGLGYDQVLVLTYEILPPAPAGHRLDPPSGDSADGLTPLEVIVLDEDEINQELEAMANRPLPSIGEDGPRAGEEVPAAEDAGEAVWQEMLSAFGDWLARQRRRGSAPWTALRVHKVYLGDDQRKEPGAVQIELRFSGRQPHLEERLARELAALFDDIPQVGECTVSETQQASGPVDDS